MEGDHSSVLLKEVLDALIPARFRQDGLVSVGKDAWYLDCTLGDGGHAIEILKLGGRVLGLDVDPEALERARQRFERAGYSKYQLIQGNFKDLKNLISQTERKDQKFGANFKLAGVIFDLGVSSLQLESTERGFSFSKMGPLDMRMDPSLNIKAWDLVNNLSGNELYEIFCDLGEEKYSKRLADTLVFARKIKPITNTTELAGIIERYTVGKREKIHPATKVFQALRIAVNDELGAIEEGLDQVVKLVEKNGRIIVISFHSLEDRIVKFAFKRWAEEGLGRIITDKPIVPSEQEVLENPRSRSAKLRIFEAGA